MKKVILACIVVVMAIASCSKKSSPSAANINGADVFANNCARCHGAQGVKDSRTPNLQTIALDKNGLVNSITHGKGHMPAFEEKLSAAESFSSNAGMWP